MPLVRSWVLRKGMRNKPVVWVEPVAETAPHGRLAYQITSEVVTPPEAERYTVVLELV